MDAIATGGCPNPGNTKAARSFSFLTAFDSIIIPLLQGAFEGQFF